MNNRFERLSSMLNQALEAREGVAINRVHEQYLKLQQQFNATPNGEGTKFTPYEICLHKLVEVLNWTGDERHLMEALPHLEPVATLAELQTVLSKIGFRSNRVSPALLRRKRDIFPCILELKEGPIIVTEALSSREFKGFDEQGECQFGLKKIQKATALILLQEADARDGGEGERQGSWFMGALRQLRRPVMATLCLTFFANVLTIGTPIYTMNVYNRVIGSNALNTLGYFFVGIAVAILAEVLLRRERGRLISYIGARMDAEITNRVFRQILTLPVQMTEAASINKQITQIRQFESIRDLLTGNLASTLLDLPFLFIFFGVIAFLSGWLVLIPFTLVILLGVVASLTLPAVRRRGRKSGYERAQYNRMSMELSGKMQAIRELGAEDVWLKRHMRVAHVSAHSMFLSRFLETALQSGSQALVMISGLFTIAIGAYQVIVGAMDTGALIAIMMIVWRILTPIQIAFLSLNRISQLKQTVQQLDKLMSIKGERRFKGRPNSLRKFEGEIRFENVSFRYGSRSEPVLKGVNFQIKHGETVAISGPTGSGKSTILKLIIGLYQPQAGRIFLDNINLQQLDVGEVRSSIGFMPQETALFYGSLAQNLLLTNPLATREQIMDALSMAGVAHDDPLLANGLDRPLRYERGDLEENDIARIALARAFIANGPFILLDSPGSQLDNKADQHFIEHIKNYKGKRTIIMITNRPSHIKVCDRFMQMQNGMLVNDMPVQAYLDALEAQKTAKG
ncbi:MAG: ABC transporter [Rhodomicrobium sp.]|nr:MAG: ABC transporter [Rhodomicrobium sp.]